MDGGKEMIFLDRQCPACHGDGCTECQGTGMVGSVGDMPVSMSRPEPCSFAECMRAWRLEHGRTFRELSAETGILPSVLSGIEDGRQMPTEEQRKKIEEVMRCSKN